MPKAKISKKKSFDFGGVDLLTAIGARMIAKAVRAHWEAQGFLGIRTETYELEHAPGVWGVRSNLVNGMPPRA